MASIESQRMIVYELDFGPGFPAKQAAAVVAWNLADAGKQFGLEHGLVSVCILGLGVTAPDSRDHGVSSSIYDPFTVGSKLDLHGLLRRGEVRIHVLVQDLDELGHDRVPAQGREQPAIDVDRGFGLFKRSRK